MLLDIEVRELSRANRITRRMVQAEPSASMNSSNFTDLPEMQSVRQYWTPQLDVKYH